MSFIKNLVHGETSCHIWYEHFFFPKQKQEFHFTSFQYFLEKKQNKTKQKKQNKPKTKMCKKH